MLAIGGIGHGATPPDRVSAELIYLNQSAGFNNADLTHALVRVYEADEATDADVKSVSKDIARLLSNFEVLGGYRVVAYSTNIDGLERCMNTQNCDPYQHGRDYVQALGHHRGGGGNIFIHRGKGGGTYGGVRRGNYVTMSSYKSPRKGPISIKTPKTLPGKNGPVHWHAAHEVTHQLLGSADNWDHDYGTSPCGKNPGRKGHYLATVTPDNEVTVMSAPNRGGQWRCGDCTSEHTDKHASLRPSDCTEEAVKDAILYAHQNLSSR